MEGADFLGFELELDNDLSIEAVERHLQRYSDDISYVHEQLTLLYQEALMTLECSRKSSVELMGVSERIEDDFRNDLLVLKTQLDRLVHETSRYVALREEKSDRLSTCLAMVNSLIALCNQSQVFSGCIENNQFLLALNCLNDMESFVETRKNGEFQHIDSFGAFQKYVDDQREKILASADQYLHKVFQYAVSHRASDIFVMDLRIDYGQEQETFLNCISAINEITDGRPIEPLRSFVEFFCYDLIEKLLRFEYKIETRDTQMRIEFDTKARSHSYPFIFENSKKAMRFFYQHFKEQFSSVFPIIEFEQSFLRSFLKFLLPFSKEDFFAQKTYICSFVSDYVQFLENDIGIDFSSHQSLLKYFHLHADKFHSEKVVTEVLHDIKDFIGCDLNQPIVNVNVKDFESGRSAFSISAHVQQMFEKFEILINEINNFQLTNFENSPKQLMQTILKNVPASTDSSLIGYPKNIALIYNNLQYLHSKLFILLIEKNKENSEIVNQELKSLVGDFKIKADELLNSFTDTYNGLLVRMLSESGLHQMKFTPDTEKVLRQCIRHVEILKPSWFAILPQDVYFEVFGSVVNHFFTRLIEIVLRFEDIPAACSESIVNLYNVVIKRFVKLFEQEPHAIEKFVKSWPKLTSLVFILKASLQNIEEQLFAGDMSLLTVFTPNELRHLVRALFQNTSRRTEVLHKIN